MPIEARSLAVLCDGLRLSCGAFVPEEPKGIVVALHGIPSVAPPDPDDEGYPGLARRLATEGWLAVWADMRATRGSPGFFSIEGWVRDARAVIQAARAIEGAAGLRVAVVGSSAGGAVSVEATKRGAPVDALVLLAAPAGWIGFAGTPGEAVRRITEEAGMALSDDVLADPSEWAQEFESVVPEKAMVSVGVPVMVVHGTADDVVPVDHAYRLADRARRGELFVLDGAPHQLRREPGVVELVLDWLERRIG
ncbi:MAG TPA: alpha/beta hydrolase [Actinomycetota bacterium]|jgi:pimeloyl-ACP methyl ester carboxylesterase|nr:alpha/beta hydrolase [Actinomycetota bacterium]